MNKQSAYELGKALLAGPLYGKDRDCIEVPQADGTWALEVYERSSGRTIRVIK